MLLARILNRIVNYSYFLYVVLKCMIMNFLLGFFLKILINERMYLMSIKKFPTNSFSSIPAVTESIVTTSKAFQSILAATDLSPTVNGETF